MFLGASNISLDAKGRLGVPMKHREPLAGKNGAGKLVLTAHPQGALLLYPMAAWEPILQRVMTFPSLDATASAWKRLLMGFADEQSLDNSGRILISPELRNYAGIEKQVMFVGQGSHFEIWNVNAWEAQVNAVKSGTAGLPPGTEDFSL
jgi:MraZ protein